MPFPWMNKNIIINLEMILFKLFLFILFGANWTLSAKNIEKCGKYAIGQLQMPVYYSSYKKAEPLQLKISGQNDHPNANDTLVSVGYFRAHGGHFYCVMVKLMGARNENGSAIFVKMRDKMHKMQQKLPRAERKHLVEMIDAGYTTPYGEGALIMELGEESFNERLYRRTVHFKSDVELLSAISELAQPLVELHKIAFHMDVNPSNYLYVREEDGHLVLKLIALEGAKYISASDQNENATIGVHAFKPEYTGPEYYDQLYGTVSTKFDIWSIGIIAFEIFLDRLRIEQGKQPMSVTERRTTLCNVGNLFLGFKRNRFGDYPANVKEVLILYSEDPNWVWQNSDAIDTVLQLWLKFPKAAFLITNLLHFRQEKRLTAQGILDYITGICFTEELKIVRDPKQLRIFNSLTFGNFKKILQKIKSKNHFKIWKDNWLKANKIYKKLKKSLKNIMKMQQTLIDQMDKSVGMQFEECETE